MTGFSAYSFGIKRTRLRDVFEVLEGQSRVVVPQRKTAIVGAGEHDSFFVDAHSVDDGFVTDKVGHKDTLWALPLFDATVRLSYIVNAHLLPPALALANEYSVG